MRREAVHQALGRQNGRNPSIKHVLFSSLWPRMASFSSLARSGRLFLQSAPSSLVRPGPAVAGNDPRLSPPASVFFFETGGKEADDKCFTLDCFGPPAVLGTFRLLRLLLPVSRSVEEVQIRPFSTPASVHQEAQVAEIKSSASLD